MSEKPTDPIPTAQPVPAVEKKPQPRDIEIAHAAKLEKISTFAAKLGIHEDELDLYGQWAAKVRLSILDRLKSQQNGRYVVVTGLSKVRVCGISRFVLE